MSEVASEATCGHAPSTMRIPSVILASGLVLSGCAHTVDLGPVADQLDRAKAEHNRALATSAALYHAVCEVEPPLAPKATCADLQSALALGASSAREALNAAIKAFNALEAVAEEIQ